MVHDPWQTSFLDRSALQARGNNNQRKKRWAQLATFCNANLSTVSLLAPNVSRNAQQSKPTTSASHQINPAAIRRSLIAVRPRGSSLPVMQLL
jgi:hypothetical protein